MSERTVEVWDCEGVYPMKLRFSVPDHDEQCPVTMEHMANSTVETHPGVVVFPDQPELSKVTLPCSHCFAAFPTVYHFARNSMRCPICRAGSEKPLDTSTLSRHIHDTLAEQLQQDEMRRRFQSVMESAQAAEELQFSTAILELEENEPVANVLHLANIRIACFMTREGEILCSTDYTMKIQPASFELLQGLNFSHITQQLSSLRVRFGIQTHNIRDLSRKMNRFQPDQISCVVYMRSHQSHIIRPFVRSPIFNITDLGLYSQNTPGVSSHECAAGSGFHFHRGISTAASGSSLLGLEWEIPFVRIMQEIMSTELSLTVFRSVGDLTIRSGIS